MDYDLKVPAGKTGEAQEVFAGYLRGCPAAMSVIGCIDIIDSLEITELEDR